MVLTMDSFQITARQGIEQNFPCFVSDNHCPFSSQSELPSLLFCAFKQQLCISSIQEYIFCQMILPKHVYIFGFILKVPTSVSHGIRPLTQAIYIHTYYVFFDALHVFLMFNNENRYLLLIRVSVICALFFLCKTKNLSVPHESKFIPCGIFYLIFE